MHSIRRAAIFKLASAAYEMELDVVRGSLHQGPGGRWMVGEHDLEAWLTAHEGEEVMLVLSSMDDERPVQPRTCRTCGRDYTEVECPYCRASRMRLRGR